MSDIEIVAQRADPAFRSEAFRCPHCKQYAKQNWGQCGPTYTKAAQTTFSSFHVGGYDIWVSRCDACTNVVLWKSGNVVWPQVSLAPEAHKDLPSEIHADYEEARAVYNASSRASAALLRLALQKLCKRLGAKGKNINEDIQFLYDEFGLGRRVRDSMDILRVVGNNAVHPGQINLDDNHEISAGLFHILNFVVEKAIAEPAQIESLYSQLPENARKAIEARDTKSRRGQKLPLESDSSG